MCGRAWQRLSPLTLSGSQRSQRTGHSETSDLSGRGHSETKRQSELAWRQDRNGRAGSVTRRWACPLKHRMWSMWSKGFMSLQGISQGDSRKATDTVLHRGEWRAASIQGLVLLGLGKFVGWFFIAATERSSLDIASNPSLIERGRVAYHTYVSAITPNPFVCACAILTGPLFEHWRDCASALALTNQSA
ncbi:hypothetical protein Trisim1_005153 [Trichoderma cf. simile WF8]